MQVDEVLRTAVAKIVTVDAGDHHVTQFERGNRLGQIGRLIDVERQRPPVRHIAKRAAPGADIAHDHERRGALAEALADVRARRFFADRYAADARAGCA
jgi:hypothetical protein